MCTTGKPENNHCGRFCSDIDRDSPDAPANMALLRRAESSTTLHRKHWFSHSDAWDGPGVWQERSADSDSAPHRTRLAPRGVRFGGGTDPRLRAHVGAGPMGVSGQRPKMASCPICKRGHLDWAYPVRSITALPAARPRDGARELPKAAVRCRHSNCPQSDDGTVQSLTGGDIYTGPRPWWSSPVLLLTDTPFQNIRRPPSP